MLPASPAASTSTSIPVSSVKAAKVSSLTPVANESWLRMVTLSPLGSAVLVVVSIEVVVPASVVGAGDSPGSVVSTGSAPQAERTRTRAVSAPVRALECAGLCVLTRVSAPSLLGAVLKQPGSGGLTSQEAGVG